MLVGLFLRRAGHLRGPETVGTDHFGQIAQLVRLKIVNYDKWISVGDLMRIQLRAFAFQHGILPEKR